MDFFQICTREVEKGPRKGEFEIYPDFTVGRSETLMVRGKHFYAIWDEARQLWSTDEYDVQRIVDRALTEYAEKQQKAGVKCSVKLLRSFGNNGWAQFRKFLSNISDNSHQLDEQLTFANSEVRKSDYVSRRLPYSLEAGSHAAWDELTNVLYKPEEKAKIEWAIGSVVAGASKTIQKFIVLYGLPGTGKSTILNIIQKLFVGYYTSFEAKALVGNSNAFSTEVFRGNPLVAIQHDGDLSKIDDNSKLNSIISHEEMTMNEKFKPSYTARVNAFLFMGTNKPVKISDAKAGILRRLIDVHPTGDLLSPNHYNALMSQIDFELGAIAHHCLEVYRKMGKNYYNGYRPTEMQLQTDVFYNFIEYNFDIFKSQNGATLKQAYELYKEFCRETNIDWVLPQYKFREELRNYFEDFSDRATVDGIQVRSYYSGFTAQSFKTPINDDATIFSLVLDEDISGVFDLGFMDCPAQYAKEDGTPSIRWSEVKTVLAEIDTSKLHYVKVPEDHIVIDFDLKDEHGNKSLERNLAAASEWPPTYGELSKSGSGVHLHYRYTGPSVSRLAPNYSPGIEVKTFTGGSSLRRLLSKCNGVPVADISSGLPLKEEKKVLDTATMKSEKGLRALIIRNLQKGVHPGTKPSIDFINKILDDAYLSGMQYDVTDLQPKLIAFANGSTNRALECLKIVKHMKFKSDDSQPPWDQRPEPAKPADKRIVFYDVEVFPNLFVVCWSYENDDNVQVLVNPSPREIEALLKLKLVGFYNRNYDNHILYAAYLGYNVEDLYKLSQKLISGSTGAKFGEAFNLSYADIYDFSTKKQGLKKFEIELGIHHMELGLPWDQPVPKELWQKVIDYCINDVKATKAVFWARKGDFLARQILARLSGLSVNDTTQKHTAKIIFGEERNPQRDFVYTDLSKDFPGYTYDRGVSTYRGETVGEGGYVYAEPGMYSNVALLDVASMHPTSISQLNLFGPYTRAFTELTAARLAIKRKELGLAAGMFDGKLAEFVADPESAKTLAEALKIAINIVYGLTSAKFDNPFRDPRNKDNIVAKRGALFMIDLKHALQDMGVTVAHIKTDSVKIPDATPEIIEFVKQFGEKWGYTFEHEATYDKVCLVNDAVYIARETVPATLHGSNEDAWKTRWHAVGAQFQHPYVYKTLFTKEPLEFADLCETKSVTQGAIHIDFSTLEKSVVDPENLKFVGSTGSFVPVKENVGGGTLYRVKDDKHYAVTGTKGYLWMEAEMAKMLDLTDSVDMGYFEKLAQDAIETIDYWGPFADMFK